MSKPAGAHPLATVADLLLLPEATRFHEIVAGDLVQKAAPTGEHGATQVALGATLFGSFSRPPGGRLPGGWWFESEVEIEFETHEVYRPDVVAWRRERSPDRPGGTPIRLRPDWVCEILSASNALSSRWGCCLGEIRKSKHNGHRQPSRRCLGGNPSAA